MGEPSGAIKITALSLSGRVLVIELDHRSQFPRASSCARPGFIKDIHGAGIEPVRHLLSCNPQSHTRTRNHAAYQRSKSYLRLGDSD